MRYKRALAFLLTFTLSLLLTASQASLHNALKPSLELALCRATAEGKIWKVKLLVYVGADVNGDPGAQSNPLFIASFKGQTKIVRYLLDHGADVNAHSVLFETPLYATTLKGHVKTAQLLLSRGADVNTSNERGDTVLFCAADANQVEMVKLLLEHGADVNIDGHRTLRSAVEKGRAQLVRLLLTHGVKLDSRSMISWNTKDLPLLLIAKKNHDSEIFDLLKQAGAEK